jgi:hypothetical protein
VQQGDAGEHEGVDGVGALKGEVQGHPTSEGMAEQDHLGTHLVEHRRHGVRVRLGAPRLGRRGGRPESGEIEGECG